MQDKRTIIIGGGPAGLYLAGLLERRNIPYIVIEAKKVGGQCLSLYPEKIVEDVPGFGPDKCKVLVRRLLYKVDKKKIHEGEKVIHIQEKEKEVIVYTEQAKYRGARAVIATGLGFYHPRPLGVIGEERCKNILYSLIRPNIMKGKKVVIFGGGDSALDWAAQLSETSTVDLVHRRNEFRGNADTIKGKNINVIKPYVPKAIYAESGVAKEISIENVETKEVTSLKADYILVNYGSAPETIDFGYERVNPGFGLKVDDQYKVSDRVYAIGDAVTINGVAKRMAPAFKQADELVSIFCGDKR